MQKAQMLTTTYDQLEHEVEFFEVSAKTGENVEKLFQRVAEKCHRVKTETRELAQCPKSRNLE